MCIQWSQIPRIDEGSRSVRTRADQEELWSVGVLVPRSEAGTGRAQGQGHFSRLPSNFGADLIHKFKQLTLLPLTIQAKDWTRG